MCVYYLGSTKTKIRMLLRMFGSREGLSGAAARTGSYKKQK